MKRILFFLITSILPLAASFPPENSFTKKHLDCIEYNYGKGRTLNDALANKYEAESLKPLIELGISNQAIDLYLAARPLIQHANNHSKAKGGEKITWGQGVTPAMRDEITRTLQEQGHYLPIKVAVSSAIHENNMTNFFNNNKRINNFNDLLDVYSGFIRNIDNREPIGTLLIGTSCSPESIAPKAAHEVQHQLNADGLKTNIARNDFWQQTKMEQNPSYQALSQEEQKKVYQKFRKKFEAHPKYKERGRALEHSADGQSAAKNQKLIPAIKDELATITRQYPNQISDTYPTSWDRETQVDIIQRLKNAEKDFVNSVIAAPFEQPAAKRQRF